MKDVKVEDIAKDVSKIDEQELKAVQAKIQQINQAQMQVGGLEVQKDMALEVLKAGQQELQVLQKTLEDKYGKVSINLTDGTIREIEDEADKKD
tara:strand:+ start:193 stop:474 length:282 start_codon:yes stop_codon:yes gene_type:complete